MKNPHQMPIYSYVDHEALSLESEDLAHSEVILSEVDWRTLTQNVSYLSTMEYYSRTFGGESIDGFIIRHFMETKLEKGDARARKWRENCSEVLVVLDCFDCP